VTIARQAVAPLLLVLACAACGLGEDPLAGSSVGSASSPPAASNPPSLVPKRMPAPSSQPRTTKPTQATLPRGGRDVFPRYRLVGYAGVTGALTLGRLGTGPLDQRVAEIATVVQGSPRRDGKYRVRMTDAQIAKYHKAARKHRAVMLLNLQPGRSEFITEAKALQKWLKEPDVGLALDPEWAMDRGQRPGGVYGHTSGAELDEVARYLSGLVKQYNLPEKVMVYHQVARSVVRKESGLKDHDGVVAIKSVDGLGHPGPKKNTYRVVNKTTPKFVHAGFKLFFTEDQRHGGRLMTPKEVLGLKPRPEYVMFE
jgi:hypothetical protein